MKPFEGFNFSDDFLNFDFLRTPVPVPKPPGITVQDLVARGTSHVKLGGKVYKIVCTETESTK